MAGERFRLDLDGVELKADSGRVICILRWRTVNGLVLRLPESVDVVVPWRLIERADLELASGTVQVKFAADARKELSWLPVGSVLRGEWTDREQLAAAPSHAGRP